MVERYGIHSVYFILVRHYKRVRTSRTTTTVLKLKLLCKENATKTSGNKADMISFKYCVVMKKLLSYRLLQLQVL